MHRPAAIAAILLLQACSISNESGLSYETERDRPCKDLFDAVKEIEIDYPTLVLHHHCETDDSGQSLCGWEVDAGSTVIAARALDFSDAISQAWGKRVDGEECSTHIDAELFASTFEDVSITWRCWDVDGECEHGWGVQIGQAWLVRDYYPLADAVTEAMFITGLPTASGHEDTGEVVLP